MSEEPKSKIILGIETGIDAGSLALITPDFPTNAMVRQETKPISRSENLLPAIHRLLDSAGVKPDKIDIIAVSTGPGSFTGIRIGIATAMGLVKALNAELFGFSVLRAMAELGTGDLTAAAVPIGKSDAAVQFFENKGGMWTATAPPEAVGFEDLAGVLSSRAVKNPVIHAGLFGILPNGEFGLNRTPCQNPAECIARFAVNHASESSLEPIYLQNPARSRGLF